MTLQQWRDVADRLKVSPDVEAELWKGHLAGDLKARNRLLEAHLWVVPTVLSMYPGFLARRGQSVDDIVQLGNLRLVRCLDAFDAKRGTFVNLAFASVKYELCKDNRSLASKVLEVSLDQPISDDGDFTLGDLVLVQEAPELRELWVGKIVNSARLSKHERMTVFLSYGEGATLEAISKQLGVCRERARQLQTNGVYKIRDAFNGTVRQVRGHKRLTTRDKTRAIERALASGERSVTEIMARAGLSDTRPVYKAAKRLGIEVKKLRRVA